MYKKKLPVGIRILFGFLSVFLCIALFATTLVTIAVTGLKVVTSKDGLQTIITEALFPKSASVRVIPKLAGGSAVSGFGALGSLGGEGMDQNILIDSIFGMVQEQFGGELPISKEDVAELLEETTIPEFIADKAAGIISDVISGEVTVNITKEEVMQLIEENADLIEEKLDITIEQEQIDAIGGWIEESEVLDNVQQGIQEAIGITPEVTPDSPTGSAGVGGPNAPHKKPAGSILDLVGPDFDMPTSIAGVFALLGAVSSTESLLICVGACLLLLVLLLLTHWGRPFAAVRSAGIPVMIAGLFMTLPGLLVPFLPTNDPQTVMIVTVAQQIFSMTTTVSLCFAGLGLVMIVAGSILNNVFKRKANAAALVTADAPAAVVEAPVVEAPVVEAATVEEIPVAETAEESPAAEAVVAAEE